MNICLYGNLLFGYWMKKTISDACNIMIVISNRSLNSLFCLLQPCGRSPIMGCKIWAKCFRIWCKRTVCGEASTNDYREDINCPEGIFNSALAKVRYSILASCTFPFSLVNGESTIPLSSVYPRTMVR